MRSSGFVRRHFSQEPSSPNSCSEGGQGAQNRIHCSGVIRGFSRTSATLRISPHFLFIVNHFFYFSTTGTEVGILQLISLFASSINGCDKDILIFFQKNDSQTSFSYSKNILMPFQFFNIQLFPIQRNNRFNSSLDRFSFLPTKLRK